MSALLHQLRRLTRTADGSRSDLSAAVRAQIYKLSMFLICKEPCAGVIEVVSTVTSYVMLR
jgi:hypothetical protein